MVEREELTITLPAEVVPYRDDLRRFIDAMVFKLAKNAHKGQWEDMSLGDAQDRLTDEVVELTDAIANKNNFVEILLEAADVGNFAMIAASIATERGK